MRPAHDCGPCTATIAGNPRPLKMSMTRPRSHPVARAPAGAPATCCGKVAATIRTRVRSRRIITGHNRWRREQIRFTLPPSSTKCRALAGSRQGHTKHSHGLVGNPAGLTGFPTIHRSGPVALRPRIAPGLPLSEASLRLVRSWRICPGRCSPRRCGRLAVGLAGRPSVCSMPVRSGEFACYWHKMTPLGDIGLVSSR